MNKICTSIEQSKRLIELGIDVNTADMFYLRADIALGEIECYPNVLHREEVGDDIPAWSLSALMNLLPEHVQVPPYLNQNKYRLNKNNGNIEFGDDYHTEKSTNLFDAVFEMVYWLKENGRI